MQYAFIRSRGGCIKNTTKMGEKRREKARKVTERKMGNMHLLKIMGS
jgi:hypothetical protein